MTALAAGLAWGVALGDIDSVTDKKLGVVLKVLQNNKTTLEVKSQKIFDEFDSLFDFNQMARNCLGKAQWNQLNDEQKKEFMDKFVKHLKNSFVDKMKFYTNQKVAFSPSERTAPSRVMLPMVLTDDAGKQYEVVFKFFDTKGEMAWLIYDVDILGVSLTQTYRSQLEGVLKNGSFADLISRIESIDMNGTK
jgi:phospholipid transport system substrate-binding protein